MVSINFNLIRYTIAAMAFTIMIFMLPVNINAGPPQIDPEGTFRLDSKCIFADFQASLEVRDPDGDTIQVFTNYGVAVRDGFYVDTYGVSHWHGYIDFDIESVCGEAYTDTLVITAQDTHSEIDMLEYGPIEFVGTMTLSMEPRVFILPGETNRMPFYLAVNSCFCLGGMALILEYDAAVLNVQNVQLGANFEDSLHLQWADDEGILRLTFYKTSTNSYCNIDSTDELFFITFYLESIEYPAGYSTTVDYYLEGEQPIDNAICDLNGLHLWYVEGCDYGELDLQLRTGAIYPLVNEYLPGDANMSNGQWPAQVIGSDVTYLVGYFRGINPGCDIAGFYNSADVNGDCLVIGSDVTRMVNYFRGLNQISYCPDYPPLWLSPDDLPTTMPDGWPNCEE
jgi:hypothetical protein